MNKKRPVNLDLSTIKQPLPAISSILHRVTGVLLFFCAVFMMYILSLSLSSQQGFSHAASIMQDSFLARLIAWGVVSLLAYHLCAGIKHLIMDAGYCEELESGKRAAQVTIIVAVVLIVLAGVWIW